MYCSWSRVTVCLWIQDIIIMEILLENERSAYLRINISEKYEEIDSYSSSVGCIINVSDPEVASEGLLLVALVKTGQP